MQRNRKDRVERLRETKDWLARPTAYPAAGNST
jgi:hypothetical protein